MPNESINELARLQIRAAARESLRRAGALGVVPTPLDAVSRACGVGETLDIAQLPANLVTRRPSAFRRILGAVFYRERVVFVDRSQGEVRARFTEAHELSHKIIPWHEAFYRLDDFARLFGPTKKMLDLEADAGAAELLFQGEVFGRRALEFRVSIAAPIALAPEFGASYHAAIRYYVEHHPDAVAVFVAGRYKWATGLVPILSSHESPSFLARFGPASGLMGSALPAVTDHEHPLGALIAKAFEEPDVVTGEATLPDIASVVHPFVAEAFYNQYSMFLVLTEAAATRRLGRRVHVERR